MLDEATANVDVETDALIQATVRKEFADCTLIAIAHRLHTVIDADTVLVMEKGRAMEYGRPADLLANTDGILTSKASDIAHAPPPVALPSPAARNRHKPYTYSVRLAAVLKQDWLLACTYGQDSCKSCFSQLNPELSLQSIDVCHFPV